ncbi:hypothetical protein HOI83_03055, partial [Candidatus Uhrbacteria bacterium]|nr:hypothetical protein [Candidatus Uhrbacteria bacterium]
MQVALLRPPATFKASSKSEVLNAAFEAGMAAATAKFESLGLTLTDDRADDPDGRVPFDVCNAAFIAAFEEVIAQNPDDDVAKSINATAALTDGFYGAVGEVPPLWQLNGTGGFLRPEPAELARFRMQRYIDPKRPGAPKIHPRRAT